MLGSAKQDKSDVYTKQKGCSQRGPQVLSICVCDLKPSVLGVYTIYVYLQQVYECMLLSLLLMIILHDNDDI